MAVYFKLNSKETGETIHPAKADDAMREFFGAEPDPSNWFEGWYDSIGFSFAVGKNFEEVRELWDFKAHIIDFIQENYDVDCGYCR